MTGAYKSYYENTKLPSHYLSREVMAGRLVIGGHQPIKIQSMTNTDTLDTASTIAQCEALALAGCELIRITTPTVRDAENLANIKRGLSSRGIEVPLAADVHYQPRAALAAAGIVEKVRINPGNYSDPPGSRIRYTDAEYDDGLVRVASRLTPLLTTCLEHGTALRVGVNQGSLSERIMSRYGDTPAGMVESALEFVRICRDAGFHNLVVSMKSSNVRIMVYATRLLVAKMALEGMDYPVHLGVTEAGDGADGRIKSAIGIGALLESGIGDTIRVSLTEDPVQEIPFARTLVKRYTVPEGRRAERKILIPPSPDPFSFTRRMSAAVGPIGGDNPPVVFSSADPPQIINPGGSPVPVTPEVLSEVVISIGQSTLPGGEKPGHGDLVKGSMDTAPGPGIRQTAGQPPVILKGIYSLEDHDAFLVAASIDLGTPLVDGFGDGIWIEAAEGAGAHAEADLPHERKEILTETAFAILQASGARITRTEFIACPSCGRTRFNIMEALKEVRLATGHLKGLKIAVMGCIVNGPGEMADADYGYVGSGPGLVTLYKARSAVQKNIPEKEAVEALVKLIRRSGDWVDP